MLSTTTAPSPLAYLSYLSARNIADLAVAALRDEADLTPKPGLVDQRGPGTHRDMDLAMMHRSATSLHGAFTLCAMAGRELPVGPRLRACVGVIGRAGEHAMLSATGGVNTHRGALWALGLLCVGAGMSTDVDSAFRNAAALSRLPDCGLGLNDAPPSHGARVLQRFHAGGARAEARAAFPNVRLRALPALQTARAAGASETEARLDALLHLMANVDDTCLLYRGGRTGLAAVHRGAQRVVAAGGVRTSLGLARLADLDGVCNARRLSPGGSGDLLAAALFIDSLHEGPRPTCAL